MTESWLPVPEFEGLYEVSDFGRVRSLDRVVADKNGREMRWSGKLLKPSSSPRYLVVSLSRPGRKPEQHQIHRLVLTAFVGPAPSGMHGMHLNDDGHDNRLVNLRWGTPKENWQQVLTHDRRTLKAHCGRGHEFTPENTYYPPGRARQCRECQRLAEHRYKERQA